jgi:hypothetical protein
MVLVMDSRMRHVLRALREAERAATGIGLQEFKVCTGCGFLSLCGGRGLNELELMAAVGQGVIFVDVIPDSGHICNSCAQLQISDPSLYHEVRRESGYISESELHALRDFVRGGGHLT